MHNRSTFDYDGLWHIRGNNYLGKINYVNNSPDLTLNSNRQRLSREVPGISNQISRGSTNQHTCTVVAILVKPSGLENMDRTATWKVTTGSPGGTDMAHRSSFSFDGVFHVRSGANYSGKVYEVNNHPNHQTYARLSPGGNIPPSYIEGFVFPIFPTNNLTGMAPGFSYWKNNYGVAMDPKHRLSSKHGGIYQAVSHENAPSVTMFKVFHTGSAYGQGSYSTRECAASNFTTPTRDRLSYGGEEQGFLHLRGVVFGIRDAGGINSAGTRQNMYPSRTSSIIGDNGFIRLSKIKNPRSGWAQPTLTSVSHG